MGICCVSNGLDKKNGVNINELGHKSESIIKDINGIDRIIKAVK